MKGSIKSKLALSLVIVLTFVAASAIQFSGLINHTYATPADAPPLIASGIVPTPSASPPVPTPTFEPANWTIQEGILYATLPFGSYHLNIYTSNPPPAGKTPIVLFFYGCCNPNTNRDNALRLGATPADPHEYLFRALLNNGYRVATLDYPAQYPVVNFNDVEAGKAAVRFFRAHAATYHIDPTRIIAWGTSGGGNPVELMGTADQHAGFDIGQHLKYSSRVEGVLIWYGDEANLSYISVDDAPFLIQDGVNDAAELKTDSQNAFQALCSAHVFAQLQWIAHAGHKFASATTTNPDYEGIAQTAITFLNAKVRDNPSPLPQ